MTKLFQTLILVSILSLPQVSFAQLNIDIGSALSTELNAEIVPEYPRPNENVSIILSLYTDDLSTANISWYKNATLIDKGIGKTKFSFKNGAAGTQTIIEIEIALANGGRISKTFTLNPASVELVWEANSYTPPFFKGKALHPKQGRLKIVAMPEFIRNGKKIPSENLVYTWSSGVETYQDKSGYGKNVFILNGSLLGRDEDVKVMVTDPANNLVAQGTLVVPTTDPEIILYQNDPYYGQLFDSSLPPVFRLAGEEIQVVAAPYFFTNETANKIQYQWALNSQNISELSNFRTAVFKKPEGKGGTSVLSLDIQNINRILQAASASLTINFNEDE